MQTLRLLDLQASEFGELENADDATHVVLRLATRVIRGAGARRQRDGTPDFVDAAPPSGLLLTHQCRAVGDVAGGPAHGVHVHRRRTPLPSLPRDDEARPHEAPGLS